MKKILLTLAAVAALTACSSTKDLQENKDINADLTPVEETLVVETPEPQVEVVSPEVIETVEEVSSIQTLFDREGLTITSEDDQITLIMPESVTFDFDRVEIKEEFKPVLNLLSDSLKENTDISVSIAGHTDSVGTPEYNQRLSLIRAEKAKKYLISQGVEEERISTTGYGSTKPVTANDDADGRSRNRRIEVTLTK